MAIILFLMAIGVALIGLLVRYSLLWLLSYLTLVWFGFEPIIIQGVMLQFHTAIAIGLFLLSLLVPFNNNNKKG